MSGQALEPDRNQIEIFVDAIFRHARTGFISLRAFYEGEDKLFRISSVPMVAGNFKFLCDIVEDDARRAAQYPKAVVFCPPLATFSNKNNARETDIAEGLTLSVECDENPEAARAMLEPLLGPVTVAVRSGGIWQSNGISYAKQHLHWRLREPARSNEQLAKLKRAREVACHLVGADPTTAPVCHPLRWPGSWHRKAEPRPCEIISDASDLDHEIDLDEALAKLEPLAPPVPAGGNGTAQPGGDWGELEGKIVRGENLHESINRLAMKMLKGGAPEVIAVQILRGLMEVSQAPRDQRWQTRFDGIPRAVSSAGRKLAAQAAITQVQATMPSPSPSPGTGSGGGSPPPSSTPTPGTGSGSSGPPPPPPPGTGPAAPAVGPSPASGPSTSPIENTLQTFERWLILPSRTPIYAMLGTVAANLLPGEPTWLGLIAPPSSAKTELINALIGLPFVVSASTLTPAGLLSGTPQRQQARGAKGGLLKQVSNPGILCLKDFTSILTMRPDAKAEILGVLREIYDGHYVRRLGTDGGRELEWKGKLGLIFGCTNVIDTHYSVENALGNRFLLSRLEPNRKQFACALKHTGASLVIMRRELAGSVTTLFATPRPDPQLLDPDADEFKRLDRVVNLIVHLRGAVERDRYKRDIQSFHGAEGPARIGLALERLLAGLDTLGVDREIALDVVESVALDSVTPVRRNVYDYLLIPLPGAAPSDPLPWRTTTDIATQIRLPNVTIHRVLEDLNGYGLCERHNRGAGVATLWRGIVFS
jgi:hypothetical protein